MFVGHYGVSFATKSRDASIPLWVLFVAVQFLDVLWAPLVILGIEKVRIVPGVTASNPLDLYYMPYTHSLVSALVWSGLAAAAYRLLARPTRGRTALLLGLAVFSHWIFDLVVHRPDLPLYDMPRRSDLDCGTIPFSRSGSSQRCSSGECGCIFGSDPDVKSAPSPSARSCWASRPTSFSARRRLPTWRLLARLWRPTRSSR